jgi:hypothetical protein
MELGLTREHLLRVVPLAYLFECVALLKTFLRLGYLPFEENVAKYFMERAAKKMESRDCLPPCSYGNS